jgi:AcrR family transcriptional regulator/DNA-binding MarR family transcriptional regulator
MAARERLRGGGALAARSRAVGGGVSSAAGKSVSTATGESGLPAAAESGFSPAGVSGIQRSRLLTAAVQTVEELGYARATVAHITHRARVSRRTFYELFANREECLVAVLESAVADIEAQVAKAGLEGLSWRERVRGGLWAILSFFDREPELARVCVVQSLRAGQGVLERREEIVRVLVAAVDEGRGESARARECGPLVGEGLVGAAFAIVHARLLRRDREPLTGLFADLMGLIVLPYLGAAAARREQERPAPKTAPAVRRDAPVIGEGERDPLQDLPMRLTYRTARVLEAVAERPGISNRGVAERAGVSDPGQISKLLARLERLGLVVNCSGGHAKGEPNAWMLTATGQQVAQTIRAYTRGREEAA